MTEIVVFCGSTCHNFCLLVYMLAFFFVVLLDRCFNLQAGYDLLDNKLSFVVLSDV